MDITRLFVGIVMLLPVAAVMALHLNWEREQRQAVPNGVPLSQRQFEQKQFEVLVSARPVRLVWVHIAISLAAIIFCLFLAWNRGDLRWSGLWLVLPLGLAALGGTAFAWSQMNAAATRLAAISSTLYGPAPPRVKVRSLLVQEPGAQS